MIEFFRHRRIRKYLNDKYVWGADGTLGTEGYILARRSDMRRFKCGCHANKVCRHPLIVSDTRDDTIQHRVDYLVQRKEAIKILTCSKNELVEYLLHPKECYRIIAEDRFKEGS